MKKALIYGAGNIGRGFIGQLFSQSGYDVVFIEVNSETVDELNRKKCYPIRIVASNKNEIVQIENVRAVNGLDSAAVINEIANADLMATCVGVNNLPRIASTLALGICQRLSNDNQIPLDILICENKMNGDTYLRGLIEKEIPLDLQAEFHNKIGFVETSIGRMVPAPTENQQKENPLLISVEPYCELPVDSAAFRAPVPEINSMIPYHPFSFYIQRKLYIHNTGHAVCSYLGWICGYTYVYEAMSDKRIISIVRQCMLEAAHALADSFSLQPEELGAYVEDLIVRFANEGLRDPIKRVCSQPERKLQREDRFWGALELCLKSGILPKGICTGIAAALSYSPSDDASAVQFHNDIVSLGVDKFVSSKMDLNTEQEKCAAELIFVATNCFSLL